MRIKAVLHKMMVRHKILAGLWCAGMLAAFLALAVLFCGLAEGSVGLAGAAVYGAILLMCANAAAGGVMRQIDFLERAEQLLAALQEAGAA